MTAKTAIICTSSALALIAEKHLGVDAHYFGAADSLTGHQFDKIIILSGCSQPMSPLEQECWTTWLEEYVRLKLKPNGIWVVI